MDALTFLRADHKSVLGMLEVLDGAPEGDGAQLSGLETMVNNLIIAESQHEAIEEQFFWPAVRRALGNGDDLANQAIAQEEAGKKLLQRLEEGRPGEPGYHEALKQFRHRGARAHHVRTGCGVAAVRRRGRPAGARSDRQTAGKREKGCANSSASEYAIRFPHAKDDGYGCRHSRPGTRCGDRS